MKHLSYHTLYFASRWIAEKTGLSYPQKRFQDLERILVESSSDLGFETPGELVEKMLSGDILKDQLNTLISGLTTGETYFYRDRKIFEALEQTILPELIFEKRKSGQILRMWSAGCSTGEEPYSIAILLSRMLADIKNWDITILATDINSVALEKASTGIYSGWSFRDAPSWIRDTCFREVCSGRFAILPDIRSMVSLSVLNLKDKIYPHFINNTVDFDIIMCRNVLMYMDKKTIGEVIDRLYNSLRWGGWLAVSPSETSNLLFGKFETVNFPGAILYRKVRKEAGSTLRAKAERAEKSGYFENLMQMDGINSDESDEMADEYGSDSPLLSEEFEAGISYSGSLCSGSSGSVFGSSGSEVSIDYEKSAENYFEELRDLHEKGDYQKALDVIDEMMHKDHASEEMRLYGMLAEIHTDLGKLDEAMLWCEKAMDADKMNPVMHYIYALIMEGKKEVHSAVRALTKAIYLDPDFVVAHIAMGRLCLKLGRDENGRRHFRNALLLLERMEKSVIVPQSSGLTAAALLNNLREYRF